MCYDERNVNIGLEIGRHHGTRLRATCAAGGCGVFFMARPPMTARYRRNSRVAQVSGRAQAWPGRPTD